MCVNIYSLPTSKYVYLSTFLYTYSSSCVYTELTWLACHRLFFFVLPSWYDPSAEIEYVCTSTRSSGLYWSWWPVTRAATRLINNSATLVKRRILVLNAVLCYGTLAEEQVRKPSLPIYISRSANRAFQFLSKIFFL